MAHLYIVAIHRRRYRPATARHARRGRRRGSEYLSGDQGAIERSVAVYTPRRRRPSRRWLRSDSRPSSNATFQEEEERKEITRLGYAKGVLSRAVRSPVTDVCPASPRGLSVLC